MNPKSFFAAIGIITVFHILSINTVAFADPGASAFKHFESRIAGTYLLREAVPDVDQDFLRLLTLTADGNWFSIDAHQQTPDLSFSDQQGVWKRSGRREIAATVIDFDIDPSTGEPTGVTRIRFVIEFSKNLHSVTGEFFGEGFTLDQDPLDPEEIPINTFASTFTGKRVTVDPK